MSANVPTISNPYARIAPAPSARHVWTEDEDAYLREHWDGTTAHMRLVGDALNIPWYDVRDRAHDLGIKNPDEAQPSDKYRGISSTSGTTSETRECVQCGSTFAIPKSYPQKRFCTPACAGKARAGKSIPRKPAYDLAPVPDSADDAASVVEKHEPIVHVAARQPEPLAQQPPLFVLADLLDLLPADRTWTAATRQRWMRAFVAAVDLIVEVEE